MVSILTPERFESSPIGRFSAREDVIARKTFPLVPVVATGRTLSAMTINSKGKSTTRGRGKGLTVAAGLLGALAASSCCILPLALFGLGVSGAWIGNFTRLAPCQPWFLAAAIACHASRVDHRLSARQCRKSGDHADRCLPILLRLHGLRIEVKAEGRRLLRVLLLWLSAMSAHSSSTRGQVGGRPLL